MKVARSCAELRRALAGSGTGAGSGLVPTMGALHEGHLSLLRLARADSEVVVLSIFVNPLQFGPSEDLAGYPRDEGRDLELAEAEGVDLVFAPSVEEMYPPGRSVMIDAGDLGRVLEGAVRPGHFEGVATVVAKLLNLVQPRRAVFGQKDAQQVAVIRRMIADLSFPVELIVGPTVRAEDGLALSSRNAYFTPGERARALRLWGALQGGREVLAGGGFPADAEARMKEVLTADEKVAIDYAVAVDPEGFGPPSPGGPVLLAVAAKVGRVRLIDNLLFDSEKGERL